MTFYNGRALHYVFKIPERERTMDFYRKVLGMKVLRHEEFKEGCDAQCNGEYDGRWSKTMVGYGPEDNHFVVELTYNYGVNHYDLGNDFLGMTIKGSEILKRAKDQNWPVEVENVLVAPGGYKFFIVDEPQSTDEDPIQKVSLASSNIAKSENYWKDVLGLKLFEKTDKSIVVGFKENETKLELEQIDAPVDRKLAYGRIAFSIPHDEQEPLSKRIEEHGQKILTPLISLDTPGKATVRVIILADPDGHEICFVDDEPFRELSQPDYDSERVLNIQIAKDKSQLSEPENESESILDIQIAKDKSDLSEPEYESESIPDIQIANDKSEFSEPEYEIESIPDIQIPKDKSEFSEPEYEIESIPDIQIPEDKSEFSEPEYEIESIPDIQIPEDKFLRMN